MNRASTITAPAEGTLPVIADHELLRPIASGSYGEVWLARSAVGTLRAVKIVRRDRFERGEDFEREFRGLQRFEPVSRTHDALVDILQIGQQDDWFYCVMELADEVGGPKPESRGPKESRSPKTEAKTPGHEVRTSELCLLSDFSLRPSDLYSPRTLRADLKSRGGLPADEVIALGLKLAAALAHLHANGLVHRDVKPSNILFIGGEAKLADAGLVAAVDDAHSLVGTPGYIPPEGPGAPQADIYSLGKVLYETALGKDRQDFPQVPPDLAGHPDHAQLLELNEIIVKACAQDPRERYASAEALLADLESLQQGKSVKRKRAFERRWELAKNIALSAMVVALVSGGAILGLRELRRNRPLSSVPQAQTLYEKGVYELQGRTLEGTLQAYTNLTEAIRLDSHFVDGYFMLFEAYVGDWAGQLPPQYSRTKNYHWALDNLQKVSPDSAQYHTANSLTKFVQEWRFEAAIAEVERALKLDPKFQRAHTLHGWEIVHARGDAATARADFKAAERLGVGGADVMSQMHLGTPDYVERNFPKAIEEYQKASRLESRCSGAHFLLGRTYEADKQYDKALDEYQAAEKTQPGNAAEIESRDKRRRSALAEKGPRGMWQVMLDEQRQSPSPIPYHTARLCAGLGYTNEVFVWLEKAYREHNAEIGQDLLIDDCWDPLRSDPAYNELLKKMGFAQVTPPRK